METERGIMMVCSKASRTQGWATTSTTSMDGVVPHGNDDRASALIVSKPVADKKRSERRRCDRFQGYIVCE